jgi:hypothetical protein
MSPQAMGGPLVRGRRLTTADEKSRVESQASKHIDKPAGVLSGGKRAMKKIPLGNGLNATVDDEDYEWLSRYRWYAYYDPQRGQTYAATDTPGGRRVFMHDAIMGLDTPDDQLWN